MSTTDPYQQDYIRRFEEKCKEKPGRRLHLTSIQACSVFVDAIERADVIKAENGQVYMRPLKETRSASDALRQTMICRRP